jgi:hypothetical protein
MALTLSQAEFVDFEFIFFLMPSYVFLLAAGIRYLVIRHMAKTSEKCMKGSFFVKKNISMILCATFVANFFVALIRYSSMQQYPYWKLYSFLYLVGAISWYVSHMLLVAEIDRELTTAWYSHKLFWVMSFFMFVARTLIDTKTNFIMLFIHAVRIFGGFVLFVYGMKNSEDYLHPLHRNSLRDSLMGHLNHAIDVNSELRDHSAKLGPPLKKFQSIRSSDLSKVTVTLANKTKYLIEDGAEIERFTLNCQVDKGAAYIVHRTRNEFYKLSSVLNENYNIAFVPKLEDTHGMEQFRKVNVLQKYLQEILKNPKVITKEVVEFLNIPEPHKRRFLEYQNIIANEISPLSSSQKKKKSETSYVELTLQKSNTKYYVEAEDDLKDRLKDFKFQGKCIAYDVLNSETEPFFKIQFTATSSTKTEKWTKTIKIDDFEGLNKEMELDLRIELPLYEQCIPHPSSHNEMYTKAYLNSAQEGINKFFNLVLTVPVYYCNSLLEFIQFDPFTLKNTADEI